MKTIVIDVDRCIGCRNCQFACKDEHVDNDWSPITKPQPEGHLWMKVSENERGSIPKLVVDWVPLMCLHCDNAPCIPSCPEDAIYKRADGIVIIDPQKCTGCKDCMEACPYGVIYFNEGLELCQKCTMCAHLLDDGWEEPRCVTACPTEALIFGEEADLGDVLANAIELLPETGAKPRVKYLNYPAPFIAGEVYSPREDICIEAARVTLTDLLTGQMTATYTDNYGDFWLKGLNTNTYSLKIEKEGYYPKEIKSIRPDANLGAIKLYKR
jgi:tetrathionate reductase subunit B